MMKIVASILALLVCTTIPQAAAASSWTKQLVQALPKEFVQGQVKATLRAQVEEMRAGIPVRRLEELLPARHLEKETEFQTLAREMYGRGQEGLSKLLDMLTRATEIELYQEDGDQPNPELLEMLDTAEADVNFYEMQLTQDLAELARLDVDADDTAAIEELQASCDGLFDNFMDALVALREAEKVVNAGDNDIDEINNLRDVAHSLYQAILSFLYEVADLSGIDESSRRLLRGNK